MSHIPEVSKLVEYAVQEQIMNHFEANNLFHQNHHGFLPFKSTATALLQVYDTFLANSEQKEFSGAILLDLSAAFDIVDHSTLLSKLTLYGFSPKAISFFRSYLCNRKQKVQVQSMISDSEDIGMQGVHQGSILGPLLFLIFMNDFPEHSPEGQSIMYADDDTEIVSDSDPNRLKIKLQNKADSAIAWIEDNKMLYSPEKTKLLIVSTKEQRTSHLEGQTLRIKVGGKFVNETTDEKLLGITMSNDMTWRAYLYGTVQNGYMVKNGLLSRLSKRVGMLAKLSKYMSHSQFKATCDGLFNSTLLYCLPLFINVWNLPSVDDMTRRSTAISKEDCRKLQVLQNKVLRCKIGNIDRRTPTSELLRQSKELSVHQLGAYHSLLTLARILVSGKPEYFVSKLILRKPVDEIIFPSRQLNTIEVNCRLSLSRSGFCYRAAKLWNSLPARLRNETRMNVFKVEAKEWVRGFIAVKPQ